MGYYIGGRVELGVNVPRVWMGRGIMDMDWRRVTVGLRGSRMVRVAKSVGWRGIAPVAVGIARRRRSRRVVLRRRSVGVSGLLVGMRVRSGLGVALGMVV